MVLRGAAGLAIGAPFVLALAMVGNCWTHDKTTEECDPDGQVPLMVSQTTTAVFAWLATPPR